MGRGVGSGRVIYVIRIGKMNLRENLGLFRDDGLGVSNAPPRQIEAIKKIIFEVFRKHDLDNWT